MKLLDNEEICIAFGEFIREAREKRGLDQKEVATMVDITQSHYSYIENGKRVISIPLGLNICSALGANFNDFIKTIL